MFLCVYANDHREKGKLGERSCATLPTSIRPRAQCQTERQHGSHLEPKDRKSFTLTLLLKPRFGLPSGHGICLLCTNLKVLDMLSNLRSPVDLVVNLCRRMVGKSCCCHIGSRLTHSGMYSIREMCFLCLSDTPEDASEREQRECWRRDGAETGGHTREIDWLCHGQTVSWSSITLPTVT